ncbi:sensor histidine kinase KdpD [Tsukamurella sp. 1534]|uniref:sensor histidine kinase n=1 Tax=Tsukamurella sp. 1534 TaxID=1151061 RepID=UPI0002EDC814|nr:HAMP domain-containing sensor histidine kinase [Tsukamurella sp. 1534]
MFLGCTAAAVFAVFAHGAPATVAVILAITFPWAGTVIAYRAAADRHRVIDRSTELDARRADQVAVLSHEIRTPLAVIQGAAELLAERRDGDLTDTQVKFVRRIEDNAVRIHTFADQMLIRARLDAGLFVVSRKSVDLRVLFRDSIDEIRDVTPATVILDAPGAPVNAPIDAQLIRQVLINLINNAARSAPPGGRIDIRLARSEGEVLVSVADGGVGMTEDQRERLFQKFSTGRPLGNGTGIGLFVSEQLVELHGGRMHVDTVTGKGTTMMFTLPLSIPRSSSPGPTPHRRLRLSGLPGKAGGVR